MAVRRYAVEVERDGRFWLVRVPEIDRATQARHLREVETMTRDLISIMEDVAPDSFELDVRLRLPEAVQRHLEESKRLRDAAAEANRRSAEEARAAAHDLVALGLPMRDVGAALGVSHQRAHQLVNS